MAPFNNNEKLSELVKLYPCLYNKQEKDFKKEDIKQRAWNEITKELNISNEKEIFLLRLRIAKANDDRRRARPLHAIVLFYERIFFFLSGHNLTLLSQFSVNGSATEIYRVILNYRPKLIIVAKSKSWR